MKRPTFWMDADEDDGPGHLGDRENFVRMLVTNVMAYVDELENREEITLTIGRIDLTPEEEEALPEL